MFWFGFNPYRWLIYHKIIENPLTFSCLLVLLIIGVFSVIVGWPAYLFLLICVLIIAIFLIAKRKKGSPFKSETFFGDEELSLIEKKCRWQMGLLTLFALFGNIISFFMTLYSLRNDHSSITTVSVMALFQFIFIGIPYLLMSQVKRKNSFWYGLFSPVILFAAIQFFALCIMMDSLDKQIISQTFNNTSFISREWPLVAPLSVVPIMFFIDSLGKAFGFCFTDDLWNWGYNKNKHKYSIVKSVRLSTIGFLASFIWSSLIAYGCYVYDSY